ncbi:MAG: cupin-like domain-containing protein [Lysobacteraceae bacterium]|nr:MAG: cupin-like domain-containing protein [Xanthomonadaceae bacterium]
MPSAIDEISADGHAFTQAGLAAREFPLVIRGLCSDWPVVVAARESDSAFARYLAGFDSGVEVDTLLLAPEAQGVIGYDAAMDGFNYRHFRVTVTQALQRLAAYSRQPGTTPAVALQSALISACLPGFGAQHPLAVLQAMIEPRLWIGNQVTTPTHFDASHNLAVVVCGRRRFTLFAPEQVANLYIGPLDFAPTGAAISMARLDQVDDPRFPRLRDALEQSRVSELEPGDAIYMPPLWWHHVASLEPLNALVNYWWQPGLGQQIAHISGMGALMHGILALKSLPRHEREAWKHLFDHYIFSDQDPAAHIPAERRSWLGPLDADLAQRLEDRVRSYLHT